MMQNVLFPVVSFLLINNLSVNGQTSEEKSAALVNAANAVVAKYQSLQSTADSGAAIQLSNDAVNTPLVSLPGGAILTAGLLTIPLDFLCRQEDTSILRNAICRICSYDCTFDHNKYGGVCGNASNPVRGTPQAIGEVCVCNESPPAKGVNITDLGTQCGPLIDPVVDGALDLALAVIVRTRMLALQCLPPNPLDKLTGGGPINKPGCPADCRQNHDYVGGTCQFTTPTANFTGEPFTGYNCVCSH